MKKDWEKIFIVHVSDKGFESRRYKEFSQIKKKNTNNSNERRLQILAAEK